MSSQRVPHHSLYSLFVAVGIRARRGSSRWRSNAAAVAAGNAIPPTTTTTRNKYLDVFLRTWDLGFTAFGGPPVHFQILHRRFVGGDGKRPWVDEQTYQELFALSQALPGPASTKLTFLLTLHHSGFLPALLVFALWSLPGAIGMYVLSLGVTKINEVLPLWAYALLSGLNAATVGIIALAGVQLSRKAISDQMTRALVVLAACAGLCYNALWYFPVLMGVAAAVAIVWDGGLRGRVGRWRERWRRRRERKRGRDGLEIAENGVGVVEGGNTGTHELPARGGTASPTAHGGLRQQQPSQEEQVQEQQEHGEEEPRIVPPHITQASHTIPMRIGITTIILFFATFTALLTLCLTLTSPPLPFSLFTSLFLAGSLIIGGGPVVIPLLRSYTVDPGWVSPRNFLLGLALIQSFPGPNFNFAVYLGSLALAHTPHHHLLGGVLGFVGIFAPGMALAVGAMSVWRAIRARWWVRSLLRGVNAAAVELVFTAVYRLWGIGFLTREEAKGRSLADEPWWVVVAVVAYSGVEWARVPPALAIVGGGVMGLAWWGAVGR